jgi:endothelin-converting enzyme
LHFIPREDHIDAVRNYNSRRLVDLKKAYPFVHWYKFFRQLIPQSIPVPETVVVSAVPYFDNLARWFQSSPPANTTRLLKNYFLIRYIYSKSSQLDFKISDLKSAISKGVFNGVYTNPPHWRHCMSSTTAAFGPILSRYFVMTKFGGEGKRKRVLDFITLIHRSWERRLKALTWLDKNTLDMALDKLHKILQQAGYGVVEPDLRSPSSLRSFYNGLVINKDTYFKNVENADLWSINYEWKQLERPPNKDDFSINSMDVNAYYS